MEANGDLTGCTFGNRRLVDAVHSSTTDEGRYKCALDFIDFLIFAFFLSRIPLWRFQFVRAMGVSTFIDLALI